MICYRFPEESKVKVKEQTLNVSVLNPAQHTLPAMLLPLDVSFEKLFFRY